MIDWQASKEDWIERVQHAWVPSLLRDARFPDAKKAIKRFGQAVDAWRSKNKDGFSFREVINIGNELGAAHALLGKLKPSDTLAYEPRLGKTKQTIDFLARGADRSRGWIDVKTVAPPWLDNDEGWKLYSKIAAEFEGAHLVVDRDFGGAGIGSQAIKARYSFITRTIELEQKIALIPPEEAGKVWLLFCGDRSSWHLDDLEDFADFYRIGRFRADDWANKATVQFMKEKQLVFSRALSGFHYVGRRHYELETDLCLGVRGPPFFAP